MIGVALKNSAFIRFIIIKQDKPLCRNKAGRLKIFFQTAFLIATEYAFGMIVVVLQKTRRAHLRCCCGTFKRMRAMAALGYAYLCFVSEIMREAV